MSRVGCVRQGRVRRMRAWCGLALAAGVFGFAPPARAQSVAFAPGSLIIPMDTDYQDAGMLTAFGLLDKLLRSGVTVNWIIAPNKVCAVTSMTGNLTKYTCSPNDMTASATDFKTGTAVVNHGYRGGPFVIDSSLASKASPVIQAWQTANGSASTFTTVHAATAQFSAPVSRVLTAAPRIAVLNDTNQSIAFGYMNAAKIPDENGLAWGNTSADLLADTAVASGALFQASGQPAYCEIMTMHWGVNSTDIPGVTAQMAKFLQFPVHVNAECQAVNAIEGNPSPDGGTGGREDFVTTAGFQWPAPAQPTYVQFANSALPFAQMDGPFKTTGGSEPAYALAPGSTYYNQDIVMIRGAGVGYGVQDLWMTGYPKGLCDISEESCNGLGKVSYLGGHDYFQGNSAPYVPVSTHPQTQGARLFLNSLYEAGCVTSEGQPSLLLQKSGPTATASANVTYLIAYGNGGPGPALDMVLTDVIPAGSSFVSATAGGTFAGGKVTWNLGDIASPSSGSVSLTVALPSKGTYTNQATGAYKVGLNTLDVTSNKTTTVWGSCGANTDCQPGQVCNMTDSTCGAPADAGQDAAADAAADATVNDGGTAGGEAGSAADATTGDDSGANGDDASLDAPIADGSGDDASSVDATPGDGSAGGPGGNGSGDALAMDGSRDGTVGSSGGSSGSGTPIADGLTGSSGSTSSGSSGGNSGDDGSSNQENTRTSASGGCACSTGAGSPARSAGGLAGALVALAFAAARRRRTRESTARQAP